jgi:hypothetical protein
MTRGIPNLSSRMSRAISLIPGANNKLNPLRWPRLLIQCSIFIAFSSFAIGAVHESRKLDELSDAEIVAAGELATRLKALSPDVDRAEADRMAHLVYQTARRLKQHYAMVWPPLFNNVLIRVGLKKRGYCFQWAEDLLATLNKLDTKTLELHWGESNCGTWRESNCIVITAKGQPFSQGILLDGWRHCGNLYWGPVAGDEEPWTENDAYERFVLDKLAARSRPDEKSVLPKNFPTTK